MKHIMPALQWLLFIISGSLVTPIAIAGLYDLSTIQTIDFLSRTFFVVSITGLLQVFLGHRLPIHEGPAGLWWGIFALYSSLGVIIYGSLNATLKVLEFSLILSGVFTLLLSNLGLIKKISNYFSPAVTGTYLILLVAQLSGSFFTGLLGIDQTGRISFPVSSMSLVIIILSLLLGRHSILKQFDIVISIIGGYLLFYLFGYTSVFEPPDSIIAFPEIFAFGIPTLDLGIIPTIFFITLLLIMNMLATIKVVESVLRQQQTKILPLSEKRAGNIMGFSQILSGLFAAMGSVPLSGAAGFFAATKITNRVPFIFASVLLLVISFIKPLISLLAVLPAAVGYAAIFPIFSGMLSIGLRELLKEPNQQKTICKVGIPLISGLGIMSIPAETFAELPPVMASTLSNGLVVGTILILIIEFVEKKGVLNRHMD